MADDTTDKPRADEAPNVTEPWASPPATDPGERPAGGRGPIWKPLLLWGLALLALVIAALLWTGSLP